LSETGEHTKAPVTGVVLAGGQSRRMGGGDKGLLELAGKPMLRHVIDRLAPQVGRTIINANGDPQRFAAFALPVVADTVEGFVGPLAGVLAGMRWSTGNVPAARWIVTAPGDAPLLPRDLVERMMEAVAEREDTIALAQSDEPVPPTFVVGVCWGAKTALTYEYPSAEGDPYYPIPKAENQELFKKYERLALATPDVWFVGRLATYRYYNMDQIVGQALATFRRINESLPVDADTSAVKVMSPSVARTS